MADRLLERSLGASSSRAEPDPLKGGDVFAWAMQQASLLREKRFGEIDIVNVADEIEDVGRGDYEKLVRNLQIVLLHLLKWDHQPQRRTRSWEASIREHRARIRFGFEDSPSLKAKQAAALGRAYELARSRASGETDLPLSRFPEICPYTWSDIMDKPLTLEGKS